MKIIEQTETKISTLIKEKAFTKLENNGSKYGVFYARDGYCDLYTEYLENAKDALVQLHRKGFRGFVVHNTSK